MLDWYCGASLTTGISTKDQSQLCSNLNGCDDQVSKSQYNGQMQMCSGFRTLPNKKINLILTFNVPHIHISYCQTPTRSDHVEAELAFPDPELPELCSCPNQSPSQPPGDGVGDDNEDGDDNDGDDNDDNDNDKDDGRAQRLLLLCGWLHHRSNSLGR